MTARQPNAPRRSLATRQWVVFGTSDELSGAAVFLAAHGASSFVTGTDIRVDGGFLSNHLTELTMLCDGFLL